MPNAISDTMEGLVHALRNTAVIYGARGGHGKHVVAMNAAEDALLAAIAQLEAAQASDPLAYVPRFPSPVRMQEPL